MQRYLHERLFPIFAFQGESVDGGLRKRGEGILESHRRRKNKEAYADELNEKRHPILCPTCGRRIMDAAWNTRTRLITPTKGRYPDYYLKCGRCAAEIGVIKIG